MGYSDNIRYFSDTKELSYLYDESIKESREADKKERLWLQARVIERRSQLTLADTDRQHGLSNHLVRDTTQTIAQMCAVLATIDEPGGDDMAFDYWPAAFDLLNLLKDVLVWSDYQWKPGPINLYRNCQASILEGYTLSNAANIYPGPLLNHIEYLCAMWGVPTRRAEYLYDEEGEVYLATYFNEEEA